MEPRRRARGYVRCSLAPLASKSLYQADLLDTHMCAGLMAQYERTGR